MKSMSDRIRNRMRKDRMSVQVTIKIPEDVVDDLKEIAPTLGFSGYIPLMRSYIGQGLRKDLQRLDQAPIQLLTESLRRQGLADDVISAVIHEAKLNVA